MENAQSHADDAPPLYTKDHPLEVATGVIWKDGDEWRFQTSADDDDTSSIIIPELFMEEDSGRWTNQFLEQDGDPTVTFVIWRYGGDPEDYDFETEPPPPPSVCMMCRMKTLLEQRKQSPNSWLQKQLARLFYQDWHGAFTESISPMWWTGNIQLVQEDFDQRKEPMPQNEWQLEKLLTLDHFIVLDSNDNSCPKKNPYNAWVDFACGEMETEHSLGAMIHIADDEEEEHNSEDAQQQTRQTTQLEKEEEEQQNKDKTKKTLEEEKPLAKKARLLQEHKDMSSIFCIKGFSYCFAAS